MNNQSFILACTNGLPPSDAVCDYASWLAKNTSGKLKLLHTLSHQSKKAESNLSGSIGLGARSDLLNELVEKEHLENKKRQQMGKEILATAQERAKSNGVEELETCLRNGSLVETLVDFQEETAITVIGRYGRLHQGEKSKGALGHHVENIIRTVSTPVMVIGKDFKEPQNALFAYNGSSAAKKALGFIIESGLFKNIQIHLVYVGEESKKTKDSLAEAEARLSEANISSKVSSLSGSAQLALSTYSNQNNIDMVVMGAYGHNRLKAFVLGSFTNKMLAGCDRPTLLLR
jgi:nucleotide-binding universal stress UspA family protein